MEEPENVPERRKPGWYTELVNKLNEHAADLDDRFARFMRGALIAFAVIGMLSAGALVGFGFLLKELGSQSDDIQNQRRESILRSCQDQNHRHDKTIREFHILEKEAIKKYPNRTKEIRSSVKSNERLVDALVPKKDCVKLVAISVER